MPKAGSKEFQLARFAFRGLLQGARAPLVRGNAPVVRQVVERTTNATSGSSSWRFGLSNLWRGIAGLTVTTGTGYYLLSESQRFQQEMAAFRRRMDELVDTLPLDVDLGQFHPDNLDFGIDAEDFEEQAYLVDTDDSEDEMPELVEVGMIEQRQAAHDNEQQITLLYSAIIELIEGGGTSLHERNDDGTIGDEVRPSEFKVGMDVIRNKDQFLARIEELYELTDGQPNEDIIDGIIEHCTKLGSYSLLKILEREEFALTEKLADNPILRHEAGAEIEFYADSCRVYQLTEQTVNGPLALRQAMDLERATERADDALFDVDPYDFETTSRAIMASLQADATARELKTSYRHTAIIRWNNKEDYRLFLQGLREEALSSGKPVTGYFLETGIHYMSGQIRVEPRDSDVAVSLIHMDPQGAWAGNFSGFDFVRNIFSCLPEAKIERVVGSEIKVQRGDSMGCSFFSLNNLYQMINAPTYLAEVIGDSYLKSAPADMRLFEYLARHTTQADVAGRSWVYDEHFEGRWQPYNYDIAVGPMVMCIPKQSYTSSGVLEGYYHHRPDFVSLDDNLEASPGVRFEGEPIFGFMGLDVERQSGWADRQAEQYLPADSYGGETINELIERYKIFVPDKSRSGDIKLDANGEPKLKSRNGWLVAVARETRLEMVEWMVNQEPRVIFDIRNQFTSQGIYERATNPSSHQRGSSATLFFRPDSSSAQIVELPDDADERDLESVFK